MLVVLETARRPGERLAFVLHDMFGFAFEDIAPDARAQRAGHATAGQPRPPAGSRSRTPRRKAADLAEQRAVIDAFLAASRSGDFEALMAVLDPEVVFRSSRTSFTDATPIAASGLAAVARRVLERDPSPHLARPAIIDGNAGVVVALPLRVLAVVSFSFGDGTLRAIDVRVQSPEPSQG